MNIDDGKIKGDLFPLKFNKSDKGKGEVSGALSDMPQAFREKFHSSITEFLKQIPPSEHDWCYSIKDDDEGLNYHLYYFHKPSENSNYIGYMVVARLGTYDMDKKEMLPDDKDKIMVFKFEKVENLLCPTNPS